MNASQPTRIQFERQLRRLQRDVLRMGALVENSCWLARKALFERDLDAAKQIAQQDKQIDQFYRQIELDCVNLMALQAPVTQDLRLLSALMQLVRDLERIGDYADDLGEIAMKLFPYPVHPCMDRVQVMSDRCRAMLAMSLAALSNLDAESGLDIKVKDDDVDSDYEELYTLLANQTNIQGAIEPIVLLVLVIRHLERMADHATNIGKRVAYIVTGQR
ncbi:phosphate signaling complex protein PhoU [Oculatella sp. FACHB-28]|uniref:phosphate signaling complex protein PhoU n=1 Tax=Cyanophyceae TaxID=3028117 RepID=UPI001685CA96|nr:MULTISPECIES: phosphate signaling complex protein PhoU [Cyanophyceae]MBD1998697.1 phosphate signaling complex protein PhoU [Leptolyngbya sp. FACHB-541]MBD2058445.1 phosphate signaling complex protein PhoU [Oculatella sp. FACHB-28]MBD2071710.1 phosphate signaling complex protein PhoU [Leptolyngbya sp. FACHB-671]